MNDSLNPHVPHQASAEHRADEATGNAMRSGGESWPATPEEIVAAAVHRAGSPSEPMPAALGLKLEALIQSGVEVEPASRNDSVGVTPALTSNTASRQRWLPWTLAAAAGIALLATVVISQRAARDRDKELTLARSQIADLSSRVRENETLLDAARADLQSRTQDLAAGTQRELRLAEQLADATRKYALLEGDHGEALLKIATLEAPVDPVQLQKSRTKLLEVPGTVRLAWSPFNLDGANPAEQPGIKGDVVWNDEKQTGYLRFEGLKVNDPKVEQYQIWVIDERGMEQKVSGGVFNANANGEVIVPIKPGIDVGKVVLFAVTVEKPGGTWVPDLRRRLVVAPRGS